MYNDSLDRPQIVLSEYIKALVHGDTNQALYYVSGNWDKVKEFGLLGKWTERKSQERAKYRFVEHIRWDIRKEECSVTECVFEVIMHTPDNGYIIKRTDELAGNGYQNGVWVAETKMPWRKAESIIRKEKNLPMESEKFKVYLKKNEYGWVFDSLNEENEKLNDFIDRS